MRALLGTSVWDDAYTFALVRNPWALMVSCYFWWLQRAPLFEHLSRRASVVKDMGGFRQFCFSEFGRSMLNEWPGTLSDWFTDDSGRDIVKFVGTVECLDRDVQTMLSEMGAVYIGPIPRLNPTKHNEST